MRIFIIFYAVFGQQPGFGHMVIHGETLPPKTQIVAAIETHSGHPGATFCTGITIVSQEDLESFVS
jgi:hypothetical protein